ncbi:hypothetical protein ACFQ3P_13705 [Paraburkholderia sabiae]|uniref:Uncharacterized protein n=1 Tax=Paraburkholderia sabiae TaxID=273251 RepID=A0ABU9QD36_9BURK|nr:hypothetical protein [Paraburkholderia sabiae]WJZ76154.1 hypothetical protein QEN71_10245 [Paraburkholderia sabiae]CAD6526146.1 hypothetical protein LMG24235_01923 [Paraburkholderia sabiae]
MSKQLSVLSLLPARDEKEVKARIARVSRIKSKLLSVLKKSNGYLSSFERERYQAEPAASLDYRLYCIELNALSQYRDDLLAVCEGEKLTDEERSMFQKHAHRISNQIDAMNKEFYSSAEKFSAALEGCALRPLPETWLYGKHAQPEEPSKTARKPKLQLITTE